jgi:AcrR family transcriptional regulator
LNYHSNLEIYMADALKSKTQQLRRDHILDAAIKIFDTDGFRGATIHTIAQAAGVSDGTVYNVFENKEDILLAVLQRLFQNAVRADAAPPPHMSLDQLMRMMMAARWNDLTPEVLAMMRVVWAEALINRDLASQYCETILAPTLSAPEPLLENLINRGDMRDTDVPMALRTMAATLIGFSMLRMLGDPLVIARSADVPGLIADILLNGLKPRQAP